MAGDDKDLRDRLFWAIDSNDIEGIRAAVEAGAELNDKHCPAVGMLLWRGQYAKVLKTLEALRDCGADLTLKNDEGKTALHFLLSQASMYQCTHHSASTSPEKLSELVPIFEVFKNARLDFNSPDLELNPPIFEYASTVTRQDLILLQRYGVKLDVANNEGKTFAHLLAEWHNIDCLKYLAENKINPNVVDDKDNTLLHAYVEGGGTEFDSFEEIVPLLHKAGVNLNARNKDGKTAVDLIRDKNVRGINFQKLGDAALTGQEVDDNEGTYSVADLVQSQIDTLQPPPAAAPAAQIATAELQRIMSAAPKPGAKRT